MSVMTGQMLIGASQQFTGGISANSTSNISCGDIIMNGASLAETLSKINERLLILEPKKELLEKYESLRIAYDHYKLMESLVDSAK